MFTAKPIFNPENCTLLLEVESSSDLYPADLDLEATKKGFQKKDEIHITVLGFKNGQIVKEAVEKISDQETIRLYT